MIPIFDLDKLELFKWKGFKLPKVYRKKLGKTQSHGLYHSDNEIEIDSRLRGKKEMEILFHELGHGMFPEFSEEKIIQISRIQTEFFWLQGYRKIDNEEE
jgi:hypothetical protein